jgi:hypothetical protein
MSIDAGIDYSTDPLCRCRLVHGNADTDGICDRCRPKVEAAQEAREKAIQDALHAFADQMPGRLWDYAVSNTLSAIVRSINMDGKCRLCGWYSDHVPGCAVEGLKELID